MVNGLFEGHKVAPTSRWGVAETSIKEEHVRYMVGSYGATGDWQLNQPALHLSWELLSHEEARAVGL